ncbi:hypothetical protein GCM10027018_28220 [Paenibacillus thermoaerophilus]
MGCGRRSRIRNGVAVRRDRWQHLADMRRPACTHTKRDAAQAGGRDIEEGTAWAAAEA